MNSRLAKHGSFEDFMICTARLARERGWDTDFVFPAIETPSIQQALEKEGASVWAVSPSWHTKTAAYRIGKLLRRLRPDVINFHFCHGLPMVGLYFACLLSGMKVVFHYHGEIRPLETLRWRDRHVSLLRLTSFFVSHIVTVSQANATFLKELNVRTPMDVVYNGIDVGLFMKRAGGAGRPRPSGDNVQFIYLGALIQRKQVHVLIQAFALVNRRSPKTRLTIVGGGDLESKCRKLASELGLQDSVVFTGLLPEYPFELLAGSDIFVTASEAESFGLVLAEAMCLGVPVVACRVGGIPEVVADQETGLLVPPYDPESLTAAMTTLASDPSLRERMAQAGRERVRQRFDLQDKVASLLDLFARLASVPSG